MGTSGQTKLIFTRQVMWPNSEGCPMVYETFIVDQARFGKPKNPDHLFKHNELLDLFHDFRCLRYRKGIFESRKAIASIIAQKL